MTPEALRPLFASLSREPDLDAAELQAYDATDELLITTAAEAIGACGPGELVIIGDRHGALTLGAAGALGATGIRVHQDPLLAERALDRNAARLGLTGAYESHGLDAALLSGARVVLVQLPRGLDALEEIAWTIARWADPEVRVFAGGRVKHMTRRMNEVLERCFGGVSAGLAVRKSRVLTATGPLAEALGTPPFPRRGDDPDLSFDLAAFGAVFGGAALDHGSRLLLETLEADPPQADPRRIVDLGCGNGVLAVSAALHRPEARIIATDQSRAAVEAARLTAEWAGAPLLGEGEDPEAPGVSVHRADGTEAVPDGWAELILLNPPFHSGAAVHLEVARRLIRSCARALAPGGELRVVYNSGLRYRQFIEYVIGPTRELARNRTFTVVSAVRRA